MNVTTQKEKYWFKRPSKVGPDFRFIIAQMSIDDGIRQDPL